MTELYIQTPQIDSLPLSKILGIPVYLKMEALQPSGSFKNRGVGHMCVHYAEQGTRCFVSSSGGNAGLAVAYAGRKLGIPVKVVVPSTTPSLAKEKIAAEGAEVIVHGQAWDDAHILAKKLASENHAAYIPPFDHPLIWAGNSTIVYEIFGSGIKPDAILLSVGGGGLLCGVLQGLHAVGWDDVTVITAETEGAASFAASMFADKLVTLDKIDTIATTLGAKRVAEEAFLWTKKHPIIPQIVTDRTAVNACCKFADDHRVLVEPACGASLALAYQGLPVLKTYQSLLIIVCGGSGVNREMLKHWDETIQ